MGYRYVYESVHSSVALRSVKGKERKKTGGFIGTEGVLKHIQEGPPRRRVGLIVEGAPARRKSCLRNSFLFTFANPPLRRRTDSRVADIVRGNRYVFGYFLIP